MSEIYPKYNIKNGTPIDVERTNENFREVIQEVNGNLSEQNFTANQISKNELKKDALLRFHKYYEPGRIMCQRADVGWTTGAATTYTEQLPDSSFGNFASGRLHYPATQ